MAYARFADLGDELAAMFGEQDRRGECALDGARLHFCVLAQTKARKAVIRFALGFAAIR